MRYARTGDTYLVRLDTGEEITAALSAFAADHKIDLGAVAGIGSAHDVVLGYYDRKAKEYYRRTIAEETEIVSLTGNIALKDGRPFPHLHVALGRQDFSAVAGHFFEGKVGGTCELVIRPLPGYFHRKLDEVTGLYLLEI